MILAQRDVDTLGTRSLSLMWVVSVQFFSRERIVRLLLDRTDIDVRAKDNDGNTALMHAIRVKNDEFARQIRQFVDTLFSFVVRVYVWKLDFM
jgi:hypothetical protein